VFATGRPIGTCPPTVPAESPRTASAVDQMVVSVGPYTFQSPPTRLRSADASSAGLYSELDAILAVSIGGTALTGGRFLLLGSIVGALLIQTLTTTILTRGVPAEATFVLKALLIVAVCLLQSEKLRSMITRRFAPRTDA